MVVSSLRNRNVTIGGRRTSMKLEPGMWDALDEICHREKMAIHEVCTRIARDHKGYNLTAATRAFILAYFRAAATDDGHLRAGHGISGDYPTRETVAGATMRAASLRLPISMNGRAGGR